MGVPVFFKWLTMRNPKILLDAAQSSPQSFESGNPHVDNFYVDMNGLIHPAVNPKGQNIKPPKDFEQQIQNIEEYMDKIMNIVRPKKFIYLAIDGVAPRAKMNQQRSRRFRAAMQTEESKKEKQKLLSEYKKMDIGSNELEQYVYKESFDSNLITPGTTFLSNVAQRIRIYIRRRLSTDRLWKNLTVVFSDANCPGEGEHKIMEFIRQERSSPNYNPNLCHCIYGADADLIMLGLATHEPRFYIIREIVVTTNDKWCTTCGKKGHFFTDCTIASSIEDQQKVAEKQNADSIGVLFQFIKIKAVRQFLHVTYEHCTFSPSFAFNLERIIDDFIFLCFFVGNDFLPHIPCLSIREGGIDVLMRVYEHCLKLMPDYITSVGHLNMKCLKIFLKELSSYEPQLVGELISKEYNQKQKQNFQKNVKPSMIKNLQQHNPRFQKRQQKKKQDESGIDPHDLLGSFKEEVKRRVTPEIDLQDYSAFNHDIFSYKEKYYSEKFRIEPKEFLQLKSSISKKYLQALQWVCLYYYEGVPSWDWFYPFHYSPFLTDIDVPLTNTKFEVGKPFKPFEQLMGVFPQKTYYALPQCLHHLMLDLNSPICDYFPSNFVIDIVGKKFAWLGEVLLPFIDSTRLLEAMGNYEEKLTDDQRRLNKLGKDNVYISRYGQLGRVLSNTQNLQLGQKIVFTHQDHSIAGQGILLMQYNETSTFQFYFVQPAGHKHDINLKDGIEYNALQQIDQDFTKRTDKRSFGGERFVRVVERSLGKRLDIERRKERFTGRNQSTEQRDDQRTYNDRQPRQPRDRSRDNYNRRNDYGNQGSNDSYRRGDRNQNDNRRQGYERSNDPRNNNSYQGQSNQNQQQYNRYNQSYQNQPYQNYNQNQGQPQNQGQAQGQNQGQAQGYQNNYGNQQQYNQRQNYQMQNNSYNQYNNRQRRDNNEQGQSQYQSNNQRPNNQQQQSRFNNNQGNNSY